MDLCIAILTSTHHTMAQAKQTYAFIFYAPDYTDEGALDRRLAVRQQHLANAKIVKEGGTPLQLNRPIKPDTTVSARPPLLVLGTDIAFRIRVSWNSEHDDSLRRHAIFRASRARWKLWILTKRGRLHLRNTLSRAPSSHITHTSLHCGTQTTEG